MAFAPITLFVYNRPWHTYKTVEALKRNVHADQSELFVFSDGSKNDAAAIKVLKVRNYLKRITGFKKVTIIERNSNFGLAKSIISGVTEVVDSYGKIIVLEDDLITSPYFLKFMNDGLELYQDSDKVISLGGYMHPLDNLPEIFFLPGTYWWGWGTWKRGWNLFEPDGSKLLQELKERNLEQKFNMNMAGGCLGMLESQVAGRNDSWDIRWQAAAFVNNKVSLFPGTSLVYNIGTDGTGIHSGKSSQFYTKLSKLPISVKDIPVIENSYILNEIINYLLAKSSIKDKIFRSIVKYYRKYC
ncbi:MAG: glycosyltransferase [Desulfobaccales bacterium]